ncbi:MAG: hypothetical protein ACE1ZZ_03905, partial [Dehalococcoidia bacterium]
EINPEINPSNTANKKEHNKLEYSRQLEHLQWETVSPPTLPAAWMDAHTKPVAGRDLRPKEDFEPQALLSQGVGGQGGRGSELAGFR